ncbi:MAG: protein translocase subunit SecD [Thermotogota bacterium]|nr:protein translocase subunit SecD [Thermotogota bacterium]
MRANQKRLIVTVAVLLLAVLPLIIPRGGAEGNTYLEKISNNIKLGLDIKGGTLLEYQMLAEGSTEELNSLADRVVQILRRRLDAAGFTEATVEKVISRISYGEEIPPVRIRVQIPGITDIDRAESLIGQTGRLYFADVIAIETNESTPSIPSNVRLEVSKRRARDAKVYWLKDIDFGKIQNGQVNNTWYLISTKINVSNDYYELDGSTIVDAKPLVNQNPQPRQGRYMVSLNFNQTGTDIFSKITSYKSGIPANDIEKRLAIILDESVIIAPIVQSAIRNGRAVIEGIQTVEESRDIAVLVSSGNLPVELDAFNKQILSPTLGRDIINAALLAGIAGIIIVMIYMIAVYGLMGITADIALVFNTVLLFGILSLTEAILTLPGIAGIILTIGTTVDGNILIFERVKEELKLGKTIENAISSGFSKVFWTIFDANLTTVIAGLVLLYFGTGTVKGFATTLIIGVIGAMFTNLVVSRIILSGMEGAINVDRYLKKARVEGNDAQ